MSDVQCQICGKSCASQRGVVLHVQRMHKADADADVDADDSYDSFDEVPQQQQQQKQKEGPKSWRIRVIEMDNGVNLLFSKRECHI